jgi:TolB-like protein
MSRIGDFFAELQRRSVIRAAVLHILFFWVLVQVADVVLPYIGIVDDPVRRAIVAGVGLFPATLIIAWFFEHPWTRFTRGRVATDIILIALITVGTTSWVMRNLPQVVHTKTSIVVLPFAHGGDSTEAVLSRALASEVNSLLMKSKSIDVIGFESATSSVLDGLEPPAIAERLNVQHVLAGSIAARGDALSIDMRLLDRAGAVLWNHVIEDTLDNLFSIQEDIATSIESRLGAGDDAVPVAEVAAQRCWMPNDPDVIEKYYTARYYIELRTDSEQAQEQIATAIRYYKELIDEYPEFAEAYSGLAWAQGNQSVYDPENAVENWQRDAARLAKIAIQHCPTLTEAIHILPNQWDHPNGWIGSYQQLTAFVDLEPHRSENYQKLSRHYRDVGLFDLALDVIDRDYALNPLSPRTIKERAFTLQKLRRMDEAIAMFDLAAELGSTGPNFARNLMQLQACDKADVDCIIAGVKQAFNGMPVDEWEDFFRRLYTAPENEEEADAIIEMAMSSVRETRGMMINWLNGQSCDFEHLTPLFFELTDYVAESEGRVYWHMPNTWNPECTNVWADPRFRDFVDELQLAEYWRHVGVWPAACRPEGEAYVCGQP